MPLRATAGGRRRQRAEQNSGHRGGDHPHRRSDIDRGIATLALGAAATGNPTFISSGQTARECGVYGRDLPNQNGAPLRLVVPWKYGFKSIKSIVRFSFTDQRPKGLWEALQPAEYGFWANVNPKVSHPRWSQADEEIIGRSERRPTLLFNGYGEFVAEIDGTRVHYVHQRSGKLPLVLTHGWPSTFAEMLPLVDRLSDD